MSSRSESFIVEQTLPSERLDKFLCRQYPVVSRATIQRLIEQGEIRVNGQLTKATHHPHAGERIDVHWPEPKSLEAKPEAIALEVLFEDEDLVVINKAADMVVHPSAGHEEHTLVNALLHHCAGRLSGIGGVLRPGIIHRLDKETSGCLVVAKNDLAHTRLAEQFAGRTLEKIYLAILCGTVLRECGEIRVAIARHPTHRKRMAATDGNGREARTSYRVLERLQGATLVEAILHTGRTHQIRVHFQHLGYPVAGDLTYGARQSKRLAEQTGYSAPRQLLHAQQLGFDHPRTGKRVRFTAPLPADFQEALERLAPGGTKVKVQV